MTRPLLVGCVCPGLHREGGASLRYFSRRPARDHEPIVLKELALEAVRYTGAALRYAVAELTTDRKPVLEAVRIDGHAPQYAAAELKADRELVLKPVRQHGRVLPHAAAELQADRELVLEAVRQDGSA